jgi:rhomboid protease GluP
MLIGRITPLVLSSGLQVLLASAAVGPAVRARRRSAVPALTFGILVILVVCAAAQLRFPSLLSLSERSPMVERGQVWRLLTAPWFQDGGLSGTMLNLILLVAIGWAAESELKRRCWIGAYVFGGLAGGVAGLAWQPIGAGNSIAVLGVAGALFAARMLRAESPRQRLHRAWPLFVCLLMAGLRDIHGLAALAGALTGLICISAIGRFDPRLI